MKKILSERIWERDTYAKAKDSQIKKTLFRNPGLVKLLDYSKSAQKILDVGCGDGRIIQILYRNNALFCGVDISKRAIRSAKFRFKSKNNLKLKIGDIEKLDLTDNSFDFVYTTYTLEHLDNPEKVVKEMIRVTRDGGRISFVCPNYGSPFQPSGMVLLTGETPLVRALKIFIKSHIYLFIKPKSLEWDKVYPKAATEDKWQPDWDTTNEPYLQTLIYFLEKKGLKMVEYSSYISESKYSPTGGVLSLLRYISETLGKFGVSPYKYYGPTLFVVAQK